MFLFTRENAVGLVRTIATFIYAWAATNIPAVESFLVESGFDEATFTLLVGGLLYQAIRWAAERWGWLGYLLVFNTKPAYSDS